MNNLDKQISALKRTSTWKRTNSSIARRVRRVYMKFFNKQQQETVGPWALRKDDKKHPLLNKTGRMKRSFQFKSNRKGFTIQNSSPYSGYHEEGTNRMPKRSALDPKNSKAIDLIVEKEIDKMMERIGLV